jgi:predicted DsbA family dithiol-disulfide isomerase
MAKKIKAANPGGQPSGANNQQLLILGAVIVGALVVLGLGILISQQSAGEAESLEENTTYGGIPITGKYANVREVTRGSDVAETVGMGVNEDGISYVGNPDAPIYIAEFADFACPACAQYASTMERFVRDFGRSGDALFLYYPTPLSSHEPYASNAARAAVCSAQQGGFWEFHDEIFRIHLAENIGAFTPARLEAMAESVGLDGAQIRECLNTNYADQAIVTARRIANEYGVSATPTLLYSLDQGQTWQPMASGDGGIGGGRPYEYIASLIRSANQGTGG